MHKAFTAIFLGPLYTGERPLSHSLVSHTMWGSIGGSTCRVIVILLVILVIILVLIILSQGGKGIFGGGNNGDDAADEIHETDAEIEDIEGGRKGKDIAVREPWFAKMVNGEIIAIARLNRGPFKEMKTGETITIRRSRAPDDKTEYPGERRFAATITGRREYPTLEAMLKKEGLKEIMPGVKSADAAIKVYREFMSEADETESGIVVFGVKKE